MDHNPTTAEARHLSFGEASTWVPAPRPAAAGSNGRPSDAVLPPTSFPWNPQLREVFDQLELVVVTLDLEGRVTDCNPALLALADREREEVVGRVWWEVFAPDTQPTDRQRFLEALRAGTLSGVREEAIATNSGRSRCVSWHDSVMREISGAVVGVTSVGLDITESNLDRHQTRTSERRFRALTDGSHEGITLIDENGSIQYSSPSAERLFGYRSGETLGTSALEYVHPEDLARVAGLFAEIVSQPDASASAEFRIRHGDGSWRWVACTARNRLSDPDVRAIVLNTRDTEEQRRAEQRLRQVEARYRTLVERLPAVVYTESNEPISRAIYVSPGVERMLGYATEDFVNDFDLWAKVTHPDDAAAVDAAEVHAFESGEPFDLEYRLVARDGRIVWVQDRAVPVHASDGTVLRWEGVLVDVTERKQAEAKYQSLVETLPAAFYIEPNSPSSARTYVSPQIAAITGYSPQAWTGDPEAWPKMIHPADRERAVAEHRRCWQTADPFIMDMRLVKPDGTVVWVRDRAVLVHDDSGRPTRWEGFIVDISGEKAAESALLEAEGRYRTLVEQIPAVTFIEALDEAATDVFVSPQIERMLGYTPTEWMEDPELWGRRLHPDDRERVLAADRALGESGEAFGIEYRILAKDGRTVWVREEATLLRDQEGAPLFWHGVMLDITELKDAEQSLQHALATEQEASERLRGLDEMRNAFLTAVSHELRTPLSVVFGASVTLQSLGDRIGPDEKGPLVDGLVDNSKKLVRLLEDLLDADRLGRGIAIPRRSSVDVLALARRMVDESGILASHDARVEGSSVVANLDVPMVERVVEHLLANAQRHTEPGSRVWVHVSRSDEGATIRVEDEGPGVPDPLKQAIFEPFRHGENVAHHAPGMGVGLSLVAQIARIHGGRAWVEDRPGGGSSFRVHLPDEDADGS